MPANTASAQTEKRATSAAHLWTVHPSPSPTERGANKVKTRSTTDAQAQGKPPSKLGEAKKFLNKYHLLPDNAMCSAQAMSEVLQTLADSYKMPENVAIALRHMAEILRHIELQHERSKPKNSLTNLVKDMHNRLSAELNAKFSTLESKLALLSPAQKQLEAMAKELGLVAKHIKVSTSNIGKSIAQVTDTSTQLANTATSYKDALLKNSERQTHNLEGLPPVDPSIVRDLDRKAHQILIDTLDPKIAELSQAATKEKVSEAIKAITNPPPPRDTTITEVNKLRKGGFTVIFKEKEVVNWFQDAGVELEFTTRISPDASISKRIYSILAPCIQLTFDPSDEKQLREIEECNSLPVGSIGKARWIKPAYRRAPSQKAAHAILTIRDASIANVCIRNGMYICGL